MDVRGTLSSFWFVVEPGVEPRRASSPQPLCSSRSSEEGTPWALPFPLTTCPSAQVDIMQMCVIELKERPGRPLFHLEHYIEGKYIKYNSNSGFVRDDNVRLTPQVRLHLGRLQGPARLNGASSFVFASVQPLPAEEGPQCGQSRGVTTPQSGACQHLHCLASCGHLFLPVTPQAFSHFTFERSGHQLIVVDIQGVGDLYTDPQIHTERGTDFGDGNLGRPGQPAGRSMETTRHPPKNLRALCCLKIAGLGDIGAFPRWWR